MPAAKQTEIALHLDLTPGKVGEYVQLGVIPQGATLDEARIAYIRHMRKRASGHVSEGANGGEVLDLTAERAKLAKAQAETAELRNAELRGELIRRDELLSTWSDRVLSWKERVRAIPASATVHIPSFTAPMARKLLELIDETLTELADGGYRDRDSGKRPRRSRKTPPTAA